MLPSGPATRTRSKTFHQSSDSNAFRPHFSPVHEWLRGLSTPLPHCLPCAKKPLRSTQPRVTPYFPSISKGTSRSAADLKRKRMMDEDDAGKRRVQPRRSDRKRTARETIGGHKEDDPSQDVPRNERGQRVPQARGQGRPAKSKAPTLTRLDEIEGDVFSATAQTSVPSEIDQTIPGIHAIADSSLPSSLSRTGTTRTSGRLSPSKIKGIKREYLEYLSPAITFETVAEGKKHWPVQIRTLWRDRISTLIHETKVVPPKLKVRSWPAHHSLSLYWYAIPG